jgi:uncharacterized repeat protein (TIGR03803 family)
MRSKKFYIGVTVAAVIALLSFVAPSPAVAQEFQILYNFAYNSGPIAGVIFDSAGNLYGTTTGGGSYSYGTVYELSPQTGGGWTQTILHSFNNNLVDGYEPYAGLAMDSAGILYGTTRAGGGQDDGTVFELTPEGGGVWTETVLHSFGSSSTEDGISPLSTPVLDSAGNLYGTTLEGGTGRSGTVFELVHGATRWEEKIIHNFVPDAAGDGGFNPRAGVILDAAGNLYGTTSACTCSYTNQGTVFELKRTGGAFAEKVLHYFYDNGSDGYNPVAALTFDAEGNLYGTTYAGGISPGTVFELSPAASGKWKEKVIHNFADNGTDGGGPAASVTFDTRGNLYSTTSVGGTYNSGTVFELTPGTGGDWSEIVLQSFDEGDGDGPNGITLDSSGNLYSTALGGSANDGGNVFEITP